MSESRYSRILVPLDGSRLAEQVLPHVVSLARPNKSEVVLMHVVAASGRLSRPPTPAQQAAMEDIGAYLKKPPPSLPKEKAWRLAGASAAGIPWTTW